MGHNKYELRLRIGLIRPREFIYLWQPRGQTAFLGPDGAAVPARELALLKAFLKKQGYEHPSLD